MSPPQVLIRVTESSQVGEARRNAARIAELTSLSETDCGKAAIVATELANNLIRHAREGEILISAFRSPSKRGVELLAIDRGPGMADVGKCLQDGFSTGGTAGQGLGAIRRLSSEFDVYSAAPGGTVVLSRILAQTAGDGNLAQWGAICLPVAGETLCGDNWSIAEVDGIVSIILADGLGHGPIAAEASNEAVGVFDADPGRDLSRMVEAAHVMMRSTRGGALAVARADFRRREMKYVGVGNISGTLQTGEQSRGLFSHNGTVGLQIHKIQEFVYPWAEKSVLIMHSDGLKSRWDLMGYPGLLQRHPSVMAGVLYRDFSRGRDDVTVAVVREVQS
ncbi:MAG TPA: ATP-binding SpoIIE family protein phosphatase [Tepidisphaeraceae bacterium]|nr:ATP-binding SpoIIE family protein phosphatase [Tepidisphaeraceae bacterium]